MRSKPSDVFNLPNFENVTNIVIFESSKYLPYLSLESSKGLETLILDRVVNNNSKFHNWNGIVF